MTTGGRAECVHDALRSLAIALRKRRMYPAASPTVVDSLLQARERLADITGDEALELEVEPDRLLYRDDTGDVEISEAELARRLHMGLIGRLRVSSELDAEGLESLLSLLLDAEEPEAVGRSIADGGIPGLTAEILDLDQLFATGGQAVGTSERVWSCLVDAWTAQRGEEMDWRSLAGEPERIAELLGWICDGNQMPEELAAFSTVDLIQLTLEQVAGTGNLETATILENTARAIRTVFDKADPETWMELLGEPLPVDVGRPPDGTTVDLSTVAAEALTAVQLESLLHYGVSSRGQGTPRLYRLFQRSLRPRADRRRVIAGLEKRLGASLDSSWPGFLSILNGESPDAHLGSDYRSVLEPDRPVPQGLWRRETIANRLGELTAENISTQLARVTSAILGRETSPEDYARVLGTLEPCLQGVLETNDFELLDEIVALLVRHRDDVNRPETIRRRAGEVVSELRDGDLVDRLFEHLESGESAFHVVWRTIDRLDIDCVPAMLDTLERNPTGEQRERLRRVLEELPRLPIQRLESRIRTGSTSFVRQLVLVLSSLSRQELLPVLLQALVHEDSGVRRATVNALVRLPDQADVQPHLLDAIGDPVLEVRVAALRALRQTASGKSIERLQELLSRSNLTGRHNRQLIAAIRAARAIGDPGLIPPLQRLARRPWIFRRRRRPVRLAARDALDRLRTRQGADEVEAPGMRSHWQEAA